jgi:hypothetical protein
MPVALLKFFFFSTPGLDIQGRQENMPHKDGTAHDPKSQIKTCPGDSPQGRLSNLCSTHGKQPGKGNCGVDVTEDSDTHVRTPEVTASNGKHNP